MSVTTATPRALAAMFPRGEPRYYSWSKFATDPLYAALFDALRDTSEPLLDVGCGMGLSAFYLRARGWRFPILGVDYDTRKIAVAREAARVHAPDLRFEVHDARNELPAHSGSVSLLDVLQYLSVEEQATLLRASAARVNAGGRLVLRSPLRAPGWRYQFSRAVDRLGAMIRWTSEGAVAYQTADQLEALLGAFGLRGTMRPCWGRTPFNNWMGVFSRPGP